MKQQLMMLLLGTASVFCSCETQLEQHVKSELILILVHGLLRTIYTTVL